MQNTITINGLALTGLLKLAAKADVRHYLCGVKVEATPGRTRLVATNGHVLGIYEDSPGENCANELENGFYEGIIPRAVLEKLRVSKREHTLTLTVDAGTSQSRSAVLHNYGTELKFQTIDGAFPDYLRIIPEIATGEADMFNPDLLSLFTGGAKALGGAGHYVQLHQNGPHDAALVVLYNCPGFVGAIMPMRPSEWNGREHLWARRPLDKPVAAPAQAAA